MAENLPSMVSYAKKHKIGMGTVAKIVGKNAASYIYGEPSDAPKVRNVVDNTRPYLKKKMMAQLAIAAPPQQQPVVPKKAKKNRRHKKRRAPSNVEELD